MRRNATPATPLQRQQRPSKDNNAPANNTTTPANNNNLYLDIIEKR